MKKKINMEKINHETEYIKISQNQYTGKAVDVTVVDRGNCHSDSKQCTERFGGRDSTSGFEFDLRYSERAS